MRTLIAGGGTGGHLTPALAVAEALRSAEQPVLMVGRRGGVAEGLAAKSGIPLATLSISGLDLSSPLSVAQFGARLPLAIASARRAIKSFDPDVVVGAAGYVCVPVVLAARSLRLPVVLMEQNALPGRAVRQLSRFARVVAASYFETARHLSGVRVVRTGNPVRAQVLALRDQVMHEAAENLLVMGGSQGARTINHATTGCIRELLDKLPELRVTHITGMSGYDEVSARRTSLSVAELARYTVLPFTEHIESLIADSDLVVTRAGGSSLAECTTIGRPLICVPYPHAGDHQKYNAAPYVEAGAATVIADSALTPASLRDEVSSIVSDRQKWRSMAQASRDSGTPNATEAVVALITEVAQS